MAPESGEAADAGRGPHRSGPFLLDAMLGKLATYLRMCGYDAAYALDRGVEDDEEVLALTGEEDRILVTRDGALAARTDGLLLETRDVDDQLRELRDAGVRLSLPETPERCGNCNAPLDRVTPDASTPEYAPDPGRSDADPSADSGTDVWRCPECGKHFWMGSHWDRVAETLGGL